MTDLIYLLYFGAILLYSRHNKKLNEKKISEHLRKPNMLYKDKKFEQAMDLVEYYIEMNPEVGQAYLLKARIHKELGNQDAYVRALETSVIWADLIEARQLLATHFENIGNHCAARYQLQKAKAIF